MILNVPIVGEVLHFWLHFFLLEGEGDLSGMFFLDPIPFRGLWSFALRFSTALNCDYTDYTFDHS